MLETSEIPAQSAQKRPVLGVAEVRALARDAEAAAGAGPADLELAATLRDVERRFRMSGPARGLFQDLLGRLAIRTEAPIGLPLDDRPFWLRQTHPLAGWQSGPALPRTADVVVVGAGLTGASAAYHLARAGAAAAGGVVVLDKGDPATEASGRNGGHFQLLPENSVGVYEGIARERRDFLRRVHRAVPREVVVAEGERQASLVLGLALRNRDLMRELVARERIDCDYAPRGWLCLADSEESEQGLCDEVTLAARHGQRIEIWSRAKILAELGLRSEYLGRFIPGDGTYHPFKYACGMLQAALRLGAQLYTHVRVQEIAPDGDGARLTTDRGTLTARRVIVATNAFTREVLPELGAIRPRQSQVMITEHAPDFARGRIVTSEIGPVFFSQPRAGARDGRAPLLLGGGADRPMKNPSSRRRSRRIHARLLELRDAMYPQLRGQPPSSEWVGPMGFTPDQLPAIGFLRPAVIVAAGFNGYGGSFTTVAGMAAAAMATTGRPPEWVPEDTFSPRRFARADPLFLTGGDALWRIAVSLCRQLQEVNEELSFELSFGRREAPPRARRRRPPRSRHRRRAVHGDELRRFPLFARFSAAELDELAALMLRREASAGTRLFEEGQAGGSCFLVVSGTVEVTRRIASAETVLAALDPGTLFGHVSTVLDEPRTASCRIGEDAVLLELERAHCETLLRSGSPLAVKFLGSFNDALIRALRAADRRLIRLREEGRPRTAPTDPAGLAATVT